MLVTDLPRVLLRQWYLVLVGLIATAGLSAFGYIKTPPTYTSSAEVLLLPPGTSVPVGGNPYLFLGGLDVAGDIVAKAMSADNTAAQLKAEGFTGEYAVVLDKTAAAPMILVTTEAPTPAASEANMALILKEIPGVLTTVQTAASAPSNALISSAVLTRTDKPVKSLKPVVRGVGLAAVAGLALTLFFTAVVDSLAQKRSSGRQTPATASRAAARDRRKVTGRPSATAAPPASAEGGATPPHAEVVAPRATPRRVPRPVEDDPDRESLEHEDLDLESRASDLAPTPR